MATRTLAGLSASLSAARSVSEALLIVTQEIADADRGAMIALYDIDQPRGTFCGRTLVVDGAAKTAALEVSLDHLPAAARRALTESRHLTAMGAQSEDYMKLLEFPRPSDGGTFLVRGCSLDGELISMIALFEPKRVFGAKVSDRLGPAIDLFAHSIERLGEHEARLEATSRLEELTRNLHEEYARTLADIEARLQQARAAAGGEGAGADPRIAELQQAAESARLDARTTAQRLSAVEEQVASAVGRLEKAHRQLYEQSEALRQQRNLLYRIERMLRDSAGSDSAKLVEDLLAVVSSSAPADTQ